MDVALTILGAWLIADFFSGLIHWAQDKLLTKESRFEFLNGIKHDNDLHHRQPTALAKYSLWENINTTVPITWPVAFVLFIAGAPTIFWLAAFFASFANIIHRWAHVPKRTLHPLVRAMQWTGLFITFDQHNRHHVKERALVDKNEADSCFCPMTDWLNPILDYIGFFSKLEKFLKR